MMTNLDRDEMLAALAEAAARVWTEGLSQLNSAQQRAMLAALHTGAKVRVIMDLDPLEVRCLLIGTNGQEVEVFRTLAA